MPRKHVVLCPEHPYHVTARSINRDRFPLPLPTIWSIMEDYLYLIVGLFGVEVFAFTLMPNHFHLIVRAPQGQLSSAMRYFMRETSREINRLSGRINQTYGQRYHRSQIESFHYFMNVYKYLYRNPVRARLATRVEDYPFSTLAGICGLQRTVIPVRADVLLFNPDFDEAILKWLNTEPAPDAEEEMRNGLRRATFSLATCRATGRPSPLEASLL